MVPPLKGNSRESLSAIKLKKIKKSSLEELDEFREVFRLVDRDDSGSITREELAEIFETIGIEATGEEIDRMMQEVDIDGSGSIEFEEFASMMSRRVKVDHTSDEVKEAFRILQIRSGTDPGKIHVDHLTEFLGAFGSERLMPKRAKELAMQLEPDVDRLIDYDEYVEMMMHW